MTAERKEVDLIKLFRSSLDWESIVSPGDRVICALSGGPDSVALCDLLNRLSRDLDFSLTAVHLNHGIRGTEADSDEKYVVRFCLSQSIPLEADRADVVSLADEKGISLEMAARSARHSFIRNIASRIGCRTIAFGHNANDRVESLLMRLLRGSGGRGLGSLQVIREHEGLTYIRPMLGFFRNEIIDYLDHRDLEYRIDSSNLGESTDRNRIRNVLLPGFIRLAEENGWSGVLESLNRSAELLSDDESMMQTIVGEHEAKISINDKGLKMPADLLSGLPEPVAGRLILAAIEKLDPSVRPEREHISAIMKIAHGKLKGPIDIPGGFTVDLIDEHVVIQEPEDPVEAPLPVEIDLENLPATINFGTTKLIFSLIKCDTDRTLTGVGQSQNTVKLSLNKDSQILILRSPEPGDRMAPLGMDGHTKKLSDIFIDSKIPRRERGLQPIMVDPGRNNEIIALPGLKMVSENAKVSIDSDRVIEVAIQWE